MQLASYCGQGLRCPLPLEHPYAFVNFAYGCQCYNFETYKNRQEVVKKGFMDRYFWHGLIAIVVIGVSANLYIWFAPRKTESLEPPSYPVEQVLQGKTLYQANCASCHGSDGAGYAQENIPAPPLNGTAHSWHHSDSQIASWIRGGLGQMPAIGAEWSDEEIKAVLAYIKQWWGPEELALQTENSRLNP